MRVKFFCQTFIMLLVALSHTVAHAQENRRPRLYYYNFDVSDIQYFVYYPAENPNYRRPAYGLYGVGFALDPDGDPNSSTSYVDEEGNPLYTVHRIVTGHNAGTASGKWQYGSLTGEHTYTVYEDRIGSDEIWKDLPPLAENEAFPLDDYDQLRFLAEESSANVPNRHVYDTPPWLTFRAWDQSAGTVYEKASFTALGTSISENEFVLELSQSPTQQQENRLADLEEKTNLFQDQSSETAQDQTGEVDALKEQLQTLTGTVADQDQTGEVDALKEQLQTLTGTVAAQDQTSEVEALKEQLQTLTGTVAAQDQTSEVDALKERLQALEETVASLTAQQGSVTTLAVANRTSQPVNVRAYPNPADQVLQFVGLSALKAYTYRIHTTGGVQRLAGRLRNADPIVISSLSKGQYVLSLHENDGTEVLNSLFWVR